MIREIILSVVLVASACADTPVASSPVTRRTVQGALDLNSATEAELAALPGIGEVTALNIVRFRARHGPFENVSHILLVRGVSERKFRAIRHLLFVRREGE